MTYTTKIPPRIETGLKFLTVDNVGQRIVGGVGAVEMRARQSATVARRNRPCEDNQRHACRFSKQRRVQVFFASSKFVIDSRIGVRCELRYIHFST